MLPPVGFRSTLSIPINLREAMSLLCVMSNNGKNTFLHIRFAHVRLNNVNYLYYIFGVDNHVYIV